MFGKGAMRPNQYHIPIAQHRSIRRDSCKYIVFSPTDYQNENSTAQKPEYLTPNPPPTKQTQTHHRFMINTTSTSSYRMKFPLPKNPRTEISIFSERAGSHHPRLPVRHEPHQPICSAHTRAPKPTFPTPIHSPLLEM